MKKYFALIIVIGALSTGAYFSQKSFVELENAPITKSTEVVSPKIEVKPQSPARVHATPPPFKPATTSEQPEIPAHSDATSYVIPVHASGSVLDAMRAFASTTSFRFEGRDYPSLGFFVESINGKKPAGGFVWIFYVNGVKSGKGVSSMHVTPDDNVEWKYEKSY